MRRINLVVLFIIMALFLTACDLQVLTTINEDGSGEFGFEMGIPDSEVDALAAFEMTPELMCEQAQSEGDLEGATVAIREEDGTTYCLITAPFANLDELREAYSEAEATINTLECDGAGACTYDITLDASQDDSGDMTEELGIEVNMFWTVTLPGTITEHNADEQSGNTLTWNVTPGSVVNMRAQSSAGGGFPWWILIVISCLCLLVLLAAGGAFFFMRKKNK